MLQISGFKNKNVFFATIHITELNKTSYMHNYIQGLLTSIFICTDI